MAEPPKTKRLRLEETRDQDLYFDDGSIVLSASDTDAGDLVMFRVHKSMLVKNSKVFKDMLSIPTPPEMESYDGLPVVHLHDDAKELKDFLGVLYDPWCVTYFLLIVANM